MADMKLTPTAPLGGYSQDFGGTTLAEVTDLALVSAAVPIGSEKAAADAVKKGFGCAIPAPGHVNTSKDKKFSLMGMSPDQMLISFTNTDPDAGPIVRKKLGTVLYQTTQTDSWVVLRIDGPMARTALERICPINLSDDVFKVGLCARTSMEHMGCVIVRHSVDSFGIMSASSSAKSCLHALEVSLRNVI